MDSVTPFALAPSISDTKLGPCIGAVGKEEYADVIKHVILFLEGKQETVVRELKKKMKQAVTALEYEKAAGFRDQIQAVNEVIAWQKTAATVSSEQYLGATILDPTAE